jgi:DNA modification methylase
MENLPAFTRSKRGDLDALVNRVLCCDAFDLLDALPDNSINAIIADPPYNTTQLDFETSIDWARFWLRARRVLVSPKSPVILFSQQPFTTDLIVSNRSGFRYEIIMEKTKSTGFLDANRRPLRSHENILIFADSLPDYSPVMETTTDKKTRSTIRDGSASHYNRARGNNYIDDGSRYPRSVWRFKMPYVLFGDKTAGGGLHPTQKPLACLERLIEMYTCTDWVILDCFTGSGTTLDAAQKLGRRFIGCDTSIQYVELARKRLAQPYTPKLFDFDDDGGSLEVQNHLQLTLTL